MMLDQKARTDFKARVSVWAEKLAVKARSVTVRPMTTKWASCSIAGSLTFDSALLLLDKNLQDYVIVHELLHFHVPNHGRLWKSLMRVHLGNYEAAEKRLRAIAGEKLHG
jgi:predicted metal-dependent hydrolase